MGADVQESLSTRPEEQQLEDSDVLDSLDLGNGHETVELSAHPNGVSQSHVAKPDEDTPDSPSQVDPGASESVRESTSEHEHTPRPGKKRKRGSSPPWQFPTANNSTLKTADGRRVSARHARTLTPQNTNSASAFSSGSDLTPLASDADSTCKKDRAKTTEDRRGDAGGKGKTISPPWKKFGTDGPTTITENGVRKSARQSRTLTSPTPKSEPKRTSQRSKNATNRLSLDGASETNTPLRKQGAKRSSIKEEGDGETKTTDRIRSLRAQISALQPSRRFGKFDDDELEQDNRKMPPPAKPSHKRRLSSPQHTPPNRPRRSRNSITEEQSTGARSAGPKIRLKFTPPVPIEPPHPSAYPPSPTRPPKLSLYQVMDVFDLRELQQPYSENEKGPPGMDHFILRNEKQAAEEGLMRRRVLDAGRPGGKLTQEGGCTIFFQTDVVEPSRIYGRVDHLANQTLYFRQLMRKEKEQHKLQAKKVAYEALERWKQLRGPTAEDIERENDRIFEAIRRQVVSDIKGKWEMVQRHVEERRRIEWEHQEEQRRQQRLQKQLEWSELQVRRQRGELSNSGSEVESDDEMVDSLGISSGEDLQDDDEQGSDESDSEVMSESSSGRSSGESDGEGEMDAEALEAYVRTRNTKPAQQAYGDGDGRPHGDDEYDFDENDDVDEKDDDDIGLSAMITSPSSFHKTNEKPEAQDDPMDIDKPVEERFETAAGMLKQEDREVKPPKRRHSLSSAQLADVIENGTSLSDDESTDMDSTDYDSDEDMSSSDDEQVEGSEKHTDAEGSEPEEVAQQPISGLLGFFTKAEQAELGIMNGLPTPIASADDEEANDQAHKKDVGSENNEAALEKVNGSNEMVARGVSSHTPELHASQEEDEDTPMVHAEASELETLEDPTKPLIPVPELLRATLRPYQQAGLDWLASLYRNNTNGILADEMGLGKTIQTIALLGHIAETYDIWHPHLIVVPTSVILNWVTEFQKFLPGFRVLGYFGSAEERQRLRKGWVNDPHNPDREKRGYNAIITSYQIALKDINAIRNVHWSYLVLDEAHNIRNFQSQKFQLLIRLRTRARLMLTGTPLQNSLTELWSLLTFLTAGGTGGTDRPEDEDNEQSQDGLKHGSLDEFLSHWKEPVNEIFNRGVDRLSVEAQAVVSKLHISLRPFLLRRLKVEVEKDLPKKTEEVVVCKLSKRQRQLYQEYMGLAEVRKALKSGGESGNGVTAGRVLMQLRRVCNHPDLFDPRPIQTSFALEESAIEPYSIKERAVLSLLSSAQHPERDQSPPVPNIFMLAAREQRWKIGLRETRISRAGIKSLKQQLESVEKEIAQLPEPDLSTFAGTRQTQQLRLKREEAAVLKACIDITQKNLDQNPIYGCSIRRRAQIRWLLDERGRPMLGRSRLILQAGEEKHSSDTIVMRSGRLQQDVMTLDQRAAKLDDVIRKFIFVTPAATAPTLDTLIPRRTQHLIRANLPDTNVPDAAHEARIRSTIAFPDRSLLIYDSGKLQQLTYLLRALQARSSRSLIFTQMTATLDILEQFLSLQSVPYLRLDGSTSVERRQLIASEFNRTDSKYQCMILSSRAGGVGLNLVGASSVIFYDLDWNPQMDRQCMDRAHRIGQVRDVSVYKMVSERTVEENILRRAGQKALLDQTVIQEGRFTTDYNLDENRAKSHEDNDIDAAFDALLSKDDKTLAGTMETVEDKEDVQAAAAARREEQNADEADFTDKSSRGASVAPMMNGRASGVDSEAGWIDQHIDGYMIRWMEQMMEGVAFIPPPKPNAKKDKHGRDRSHRPKKR